MDISQYFEPLAFETQRFLCESSMPTIAEKVSAYAVGAAFPEVEDYSLALFGVADDRGSLGNKGCAEAPNRVRSFLYSLVAPVSQIKLYDLGNYVPAGSPDDTYAAVTDILSQLIEHNVTAIVLGGGQDITYAMYEAYARQGKLINICAVDPRFDIAGHSSITSQSYLNHIIMRNSRYLFNYTTMGYQTYLVGDDNIKLMEELDFYAYRLGYVQADLVRAEPLVRNADLVTVDISAVRQSDAPAHAHPSPHGFYGEQLCQIFRFAGMSDKVSSLGLFELNPLYDHAGQTAHMAAHALWYFIEGFHSRRNDTPVFVEGADGITLDKRGCKQFLVQMESPDMELVFYKSRATDRWWIELPCPNEALKRRYLRHLIIPCNYSDYECAMHNEIPELWYRYYKRLTL